MTETKVTAATLAAALSGLILWGLGTYALRGAVPAPVALVVALAVPAGVTFAAGYLAKHTHRPDLPPPSETPPAPPTAEP